MIMNHTVWNIIRNKMCNYCVIMFVTPVLIFIGFVQINYFIGLSCLTVGFDT